MSYEESPQTPPGAPGLRATSPPQYQGQYPAETSPPPTAPGAATLPFTNSRATRHLCAGVYLDETFQRRVLDEVYNEPRRAIAPTAGTDAAAVVLHAKRARNLSTCQASILSGLIVLFLCTAGVETALTAAILIVWQLGTAVAQLISGTFAYMKNDDPMGPRQLFGRLLLILIGSVIALPVLVLAIPFVFMILLSSVLSSGLRSSGGSSYPGNSDSIDLPGSEPALFFVVLLLPLVTVAIFAGIRRVYVRQLAFGVGDTGYTDDGKSKRIRFGQHGDVVNYSGYSPFVGYGEELWTWELALPLYPRHDNPGHDMRSSGPGFTGSQLIYEIHRGLYDYLNDTPGFKRLPGLILSDQVFVAGKDTKEPTHFVAELPRSGFPGDMTAIQDDPTLPVRRYLKCQINSWDGELVTSVFVTAALQGETLYMEFSSHVLPPTREEFHVLDDKSQISGFAVAVDVLRAIGRLPVHIGRSPAVLWRLLRDSIRATSRHGRLPEELVGSQDSGARVSVRELGTDVDVHNYFQEHDSVKYTSILQTQILEHTVRFLDRFVDVSELKRRKETIVNNTIVNQGSVYTASQTGSGHVGAMGNRAQGTVTSKGPTA